MRSGTFTDTTLRRKRHALAGDRLFRKRGRQVHGDHRSGGHLQLRPWLRVWESESPISTRTGTPISYVGNDFHEDDYLYLNKGGLYFTESLGKMIRHTSTRSMGKDLVDINNDGLIDIISPGHAARRVRRLEGFPYRRSAEIADLKRSYGYKPQVSRNTLQLNRARGDSARSACWLGVSATDWSWAALGAISTTTDIRTSSSPMAFIAGRTISITQFYLADRHTAAAQRTTDGGGPQPGRPRAILKKQRYRGSDTCSPALLTDGRVGRPG